MYQLSPGVIIQEIDLTGIVPAVGTTEAGFVGHFMWGPLNEIRTITSEQDLAYQFWKPSANNYEHFFTVANFLSYGRNVKVVRTANTSVIKNATADGTGVLVKNEVDWENNYKNGGGSTGIWAARYAGALGNSLAVSYCPSANAFSAVMTATANTTAGSNIVHFSANVKTDATRILVPGDYIQINTFGYVEVTAIDSTGINVTVNSATIINANQTAQSCNASWRYASQFDNRPGTSQFSLARNGLNDEMHIIVLDKTGIISGLANTILEKWQFVSKAQDATNDDGSVAYYRDVLWGNSRWLWWMDHPDAGTNWGTTANNTIFTNVTSCEYSSMAGGVDSVPTTANMLTAWDMFRNFDEVDVSLLMTGPSNQIINTYVIQQIAEYRKDCVVFLSPNKTDVVDNLLDEMYDVIAYRNLLPSSSYGFMDCNWKYMFDKYNNLFRWVPLNGDIAGLCVRTDFERDPWWSPAGFNRGQIKNVIKLAWKPNQTHRDELYKSGVNPCLTFPGEGTILYGDKTMLSKPSAFDRINVRRLFIVLEKAISRAAKYSLFEFNDAFTRAQFIAMVDPFIRDIKGRRGIYDYRVVCDETNNTPVVIDRNEFIADIYIKPARSINFITLRFIATPTGLSFDEVIGRF